MRFSSFGDVVRRYFAILFRWGWLIVLTTVVAGGVAYGISIRLTPIYQASVKLLINQAPATKSADLASVMTSERLAQTYAQIATMKSVLDTVIDDLDLPTKAEIMRESIQVNPLQDTQLIQIDYEDPNPEMAASVLNYLVDVFIEQNRIMQEDRFIVSKNNLIKQLDEINERIRVTSMSLEGLEDSLEDQETRTRTEASLAEYRRIYSSLLLSFEQVRLAEAQSTSTLIPVERARVPVKPILPTIPLNTIVSAILGAIISIAAAFTIEALDSTIKSPDDIQRHLGLPVLAFIARYNQEVAMIADNEPRAPVSEAFRSLRTNLTYASVDRPLTTLLVTSPSPSDGKSTIATNLSIVIAQGGSRVILIDADLRRPKIHQIFKIRNRMGMTSLFVQTHLNLDGSLQKTSVEGLSLLTAGEIPPNPSELLGTERFNEILENAKTNADVIVIDSPPVMAVTDSAVLARKVDGVLLVIKPGTTNQAAAKQAVEQLRRVGANLLGVVLNEVETGRFQYQKYRYQGYYYSYNYNHQDNDSGVSTRKKNGLKWKRDKTGNKEKVSPAKPG